MSYSFTVRAASKAEANQKVADELANVVASQPVHEADRDQAQAAATAFIGLLRFDETQDISVSVNGSVWSVDGGLNSAGIGVSVSLVPKEGQ
ncbi:MAG: hypothetical protein ACR652_17705 [Methylocystis sp.]|uniref:hypothetical protein n=1 Tax=Methylocystis sp. TaxID=1911079 RepID=UPI003DA37C7C